MVQLRQLRFESISVRYLLNYLESYTTGKIREAKENQSGIQTHKWKINAVAKKKITVHKTQHKNEDVKDPTTKMASPEGKIVPVILLI